MIYNVTDYNRLSKRLKKAIQEKSLSHDELKKISTQIKQRNDDIHELIKKVMLFVIIIVFLMIFLSRISIINISKPIVSIIKFSIVCLAVSILYALLYFTCIGIIKKQFNSAVKKSYPELANEIKL